MVALARADIRRLFELLNGELREAGISGEAYLVGGAVMCLAYATRPSTADVDGYFRPTKQVLQAAVRVAVKAGLPSDWLNDGVKGYLSQAGDFAPYLELDHLRVMIAQPQYLLAMKCLAMRIGAEFHDEEDIRFLLRLLDLRSHAQAVEIITKYYPLGRFPQKTLYALEELLPDTRLSS